MTNTIRKKLTDGLLIIKKQQRNLIKDGIPLVEKQASCHNLPVGNFKAILISMTECHLFDKAFMFRTLKVSGYELNYYEEETDMIDLCVIGCIQSPS